MPYYSRLLHAFRRWQNLLLFPSLGAPFFRAMGETDMPRYSAETLEAMGKLLLSYRDDMRVEVEQGIAIAAKTVADLSCRPFLAARINPERPFRS
jgi:hypothetical protein